MEVKVENNSSTFATSTLYQAIIKGDIACFHNLLRKDPLIVDQCIIENSSRFSLSPLHVAAHVGNLEMVTTLLHMNPSMCLAHDQDGRNPIQVAAIRGHVDVIQVLHQENPYAAQERTNGGETILHLCIKNKQLNALEVLLQLTDDDGHQLLNSKDNNENTILHLAVTSKQPTVVEYLLGQSKIEKNAINKNKMTVVDIHMKQSRKNLGDGRIEEALKHVKAKPAKDALNQQADNAWLEEQRPSLMVVASLVATMAFEVGISPPGGFWQDNKSNSTDPITDSPVPAIAGEAILSYTSSNYGSYKMILVYNTLALISSLSVILLLISGFPCKRYFISILRITLWITVTATTLTYATSVSILTYDTDPSFWDFLTYSIYGWLVLVGTIFLGNVVSLVWKSLRWQRKEAVKRCCKN